MSRPKFILKSEFLEPKVRLYKIKTKPTSNKESQNLHCFKKVIYLIINKIIDYLAAISATIPFATFTLTLSAISTDKVPSSLT